MKSMTAYGYAEYSCDKYIMTMELKSYNNRYLDISYTAPSYLSAYENEINELIKLRAKRGHIDVSVKIKNLEGSIKVDVDEPVARAYIDAYKKIANLASSMNLHIHGVRVGALAEQEGVLTVVKDTNLEDYRMGLNFCSMEVLRQFDEAKSREGLATEKDLSQKINKMEESLNFIASKASALEDLVKKNLKDHVRDMLQDADYEEQRILYEVSIMAMRYTINEEIVRLGTHISEFKKLMTSLEPIGKKMDFLCQEMNREINTIGSKSIMVEVNLEVVNMKDCLENIREQLRNIE